MKSVVSVERIGQRIHGIRGVRVMLDADLAELYGVETRSLVQAVKRNRDRFPSDFMFVLTREELTNLRSQFVISSGGSHGGRRSLPLAFTEQGVAMLSSVLRSERAVKANIAIMRAFVLLRRVLIDHEELNRRLAALENRLTKHDEDFAVVFRAIKELMKQPEPKSKHRIGFLSGE